ncbi:MAG: helix-turn-helix domain-containing protein [Pseudomonadota bacterium]
MTTTLQQPLRHWVELAIKQYFENLDGLPAENMYELVLSEVHIGLLRAVMQEAHGNQTKAAEYLGIARGTLRKLLLTHGIDTHAHTE